jgi:hypothetical protein
MLSCSFFTVTVSAQTAIDWGERFRYRGEVVRILQPEGRNFAIAGLPKSLWGALSPHSKKLEVLSLSNLTPVSTTSFRLRLDGKKVAPFHVVESSTYDLITIGKRTSFFSSQPKVFYHYFNRQGTDREVEGKLITSYRLSPQYKNLSFTGIQQSPDFSKAGIHYSIPVGPADYPGFGYVLFDEVNGAYREELNMLSFKMNEMDIYDHFLTNDGVYYMIGKEFTNRNIYNPFITTEGDVVRSRIFQDTDEGLVEIPLNTLNIIPQDVQLLTKNEELLVSGFYTDDAQSDVRGVFFTRIDRATNEVISTTSQPFSQAFLSSGKAAWERSYWDELVAQQNRDYQLNNFRILEFQMTSDSGFVVVAEHQEVDAIQKNSSTEENTTPKYDYRYYFDDVIVYKLSSEGILEWVERIPKTQSSLNDEGAFSSVLVAINQEKVHLFFNDSQRNYDQTSLKFDQEREQPFSSSLGFQNVIGHVELDVFSGKAQRKMLAGRGELKVVFNPKLSRYNPETKEVIFYGNRNNRHRFGFWKLP